MGKPTRRAVGDRETLTQRQAFSAAAAAVSSNFSVSKRKITASEEGHQGVPWEEGWLSHQLQYGTGEAKPDTRQKDRRDALLALAEDLRFDEIET